MKKKSSYPQSNEDNVLKTDLLNMPVSFTSKESQKVLADFKQLIANIIQFHKGVGKSKNYHIEFNSKTGEYGVFYKGKKYCTVKNFLFKKEDAGSFNTEINTEKKYILERITSNENDNKV